MASQVNTITVTGKTGPASQVTSQAFSNVRQLLFDYDEQTVTVFTADKNRGVTFQLDSITTITYTITGGAATVTIS